MNRPLTDSTQRHSTSALPPIGVIALNRMGFGPRPGDLDAFNALGSTDLERLNKYVDQQLSPDSINDSELQTRISAAGFTTIEKSLSQLWEDHFVNHNGDYNYRTLPFRETERLTFLRAVYSKRQLAEVVADFWHNHFNIYGLDYWSGPIFIQHDRDVIRGNMLGNFRELLGAVAKSTAMLTYLDNYTNSNAGPNENFARELFERHTLGAMNYLGVGRQDQVPKDSEGRALGYVDDDVYEAARCFTGWTIRNQSTDPSIGNTGEFIYRADWHDRFQKHVLGSFLPPDQAELVDGQAVLDLLAFHPGTARNIAYKLCRRLVSDNPAESLVNSTAGVFYDQRNSPTQIAAVVRHILTSPDFRTTWAQKVKRPFEVLASAMRASSMDFTFTVSDQISLSFFWLFDDTGQPLFKRKSPDGYPDTMSDWLNTSTLITRWRLLNWLATVENADGSLIIDPFALTPAHIRSSAALADYWIERVFGRAISSAERNIIVDFMAQGLSPNLALNLETDPNIQKRLTSMVALLFLSPEFQWR